MSAPLISVIMPSYNHAKYLREAVESVWSQSYSNLEIVLVDDASSDGSTLLLESLRGSSPIPMRVEVNEQNRGPAFSIGKAFELSSGELIAFLASDDVYAPSRFEAQLRCFSEDPQLLLSYADGVMLNEGNTHGAHIHGEKVKRLLQKPPAEILRFLYIHGSPLYIQCALIKRSLLLESNAFDRSALADDWLINLRMFECLAQRGHCAYVDQVVCYYRIHAENAHKNKDRQIALSKEIIERYTPVHVRHLARSNVYWQIGLWLAKDRPIESFKYLYLSQLNQFRPWRLLDLARRALWVLARKLMKSLRG